MTIQHQHPPSPQQNNPRSPHAKNPSLAHARPHRPAPLTRRKTPQGVQKVGAGWSKSFDKKEEEEGMAASFLQFCATCEKQIIVPNNSILYCSESCRRKDSIKTPTYAFFNSSPSPPLSPFSNPLGDEYPVRDIVPQRSPTVRTTPTYFCPPSPKSPPLSTSPTSSNNERRPSVAQAYLQQFHMTISNLPRQHSSQHYQRHSQYSSAATTPSLSHAMTPASSVSTSTNNHSYGLSNRPLPPRHNPSYSASASPRSIDLVTPFTPSAPASLVHTNRNGSSSSLKANTMANATSSGAKAHSSAALHNDLLYEKKYSLPSAGVAEGPGSLKQLLSFEESKKG